MSHRTSQDSAGMKWLSENFWIALAVAIIVISVSLALIMYCVCRWQFRKGKKCEISNSLNQNEDEDKTYENVFNQSPPLPPRDFPSLEGASPQVTPSQLPNIYSLPQKGRYAKKVSVPNYVQPEDDYDDIEIPATLGKHDLKTRISSF
ncbi:SLP adapter and CSK-interacting membrane protein isoform X2 [Loxodonta africana]|uniref:SLP adapter and CSK-interacting membrane protein isoform X2 n=1 Tax=Loxodonta africana TaxID=9785 RepID=UPI000C811262|nr:SLP adapter and CSK-interacting membrane protein isoform X2 [Loxodonta africana]